MNIGGVLGVTVILVLITMLQWPKLKKQEKKVKLAFVSLILFNWCLAVLLVVFPDMPGPGQIIDFIYKPFELFW